METRDSNFSEGIAIVVGGSGGIGGAICEALARAGSDVVLTYRTNRAAADDVAQRIRSLGRVAELAQLEVESAPSVKLLVADVLLRHNRIHSAVYASGPHLNFKFISELTPADWATVFNVDVIGCFNLVWSVLPHFREINAGGFLAVTTSAVKRVPVRDILSGAPKAAIEMLIHGVAKEEGRYGIRANCVGPGWIDGGLGRRAMREQLSAETVAANRKSIPLRRFGECADVAAAAAFLLSAAGNYITGQSLAVDGGMQL